MNKSLFVVGSLNSAKVRAVEEIVKENPTFAQSKIIAVQALSGVSDNPLSLEETLEGAKNRSKHAFEACPEASYGVGIESGLMEAPGTSTGFFNISIATIFDGENWCTGLSSGFEVPYRILVLVRDQKMDLTKACLASGISSNPNLGSTEGLIGILTGGKIDRKEYSKQALQTAIVQLEPRFANFYKKLNNDPISSKTSFSSPP